VESYLVDAALALVILASMWGGWVRGFLLSATQLLSLLGALVIAFIGYQPVARWVEPWWPGAGVWLYPASFLLVFLVLQMVLGGMSGPLLRAAGPRVHAHGINRFLGLAPGAANGLVNACVIALLLQTLPLGERISRMARESVAAQALSGPAEWLEAQLTPIFDPAIRRSLQGLTVLPESKASIKLPFSVTNARPRPDLEARMLEMVNAERAKAGLRPLRADPEVVPVARAHSQDMFARSYFSHVSPEGGTLGERLRKQELRYLLAGENLALASTLARAHQGLMDSPGHRANILRAEFGRVGIGVLDGGTHGLMVTQNFRN
jgi:uncharacterized protein YkwD